MNLIPSLLFVFALLFLLGFSSFPCSEGSLSVSVEIPPEAEVSVAVEDSATRSSSVPVDEYSAWRELRGDEPFLARRDEEIEEKLNSIDSSSSQEEIDAAIRSLVHIEAGSPYSHLSHHLNRRRSGESLSHRRQLRDENGKIHRVHLDTQHLPHFYRVQENIAEVHCETPNARGISRTLISLVRPGEPVFRSDAPHSPAEHFLPRGSIVVFESPSTGCLTHSQQYSFDKHSQRFLRSPVYRRVMRSVQLVHDENLPEFHRPHQFVLWTKAAEWKDSVFEATFDVESHDIFSPHFHRAAKKESEENEENSWRHVPDDHPDVKDRLRGAEEELRAAIGTELMNLQQKALEDAERFNEEYSSSNDMELNAAAAPADDGPTPEDYIPAKMPPRATGEKVETVDPQEEIQAEFMRKAEEKARALHNQARRRIPYLGLCGLPLNADELQVGSCVAPGDCGEMRGQPTTPKQFADNGMCTQQIQDYPGRTFTCCLTTKPGETPKTSWTDFFANGFTFSSSGIGLGGMKLAKISNFNQAVKNRVASARKKAAAAPKPPTVKPMKTLSPDHPVMKAHNAQTEKIRTNFITNKQYFQGADGRNGKSALLRKDLFTWSLNGAKSTETQGASLQLAAGWNYNGRTAMNSNDYIVFYQHRVATVSCLGCYFGVNVGVSFKGFLSIFSSKADFTALFRGQLVMKMIVQLSILSGFIMHQLELLKLPPMPVIIPTPIPLLAITVQLGINFFTETGGAVGFGMGYESRSSSVGGFRYKEGKFSVIDDKSNPWAGKQNQYYPPQLTINSRATVFTGVALDIGVTYGGVVKGSLSVGPGIMVAGTFVPTAKTIIGCKAGDNFQLSVIPLVQITLRGGFNAPNWVKKVPFIGSTAAAIIKDWTFQLPDIMWPPPPLINICMKMKGFERILSAAEKLTLGKRTDAGTIQAIGGSEEGEEAQKLLQNQECLLPAASSLVLSANAPVPLRFFSSPSGSFPFATFSAVSRLPTCFSDLLIRPPFQGSQEDYFTLAQQANEKGIDANRFLGGNSTNRLILIHAEYQTEKAGKIKIRLRTVENSDNQRKSEALAILQQPAVFQVNRQALSSSPSACLEDRLIPRLDLGDGPIPQQNPDTLGLFLGCPKAGLLSHGSFSGPGGFPLDVQADERISIIAGIVVNWADEKIPTIDKIWEILIEIM